MSRCAIRTLSIAGQNVWRFHIAASRFRIAFWRAHVAALRFCIADWHVHIATLRFCITVWRFCIAVEAHIRIDGLGRAQRFEIVPDGIAKLTTALAGNGRDLEHRPLPVERLHQTFAHLGHLVRRHHVDLVQHQPAWLFVEGRVVLTQLVDDGPGLVHHITVGVEREDVHQVQQQPGTLQVPQKTVPQARTLGGPTDQPRHIGHHEAAPLVDAHHTQVGMQRGERVVCHLRSRIGYLRNESGFAGVGHAQQPHVGQHLQLQLQAPLLARPSRRGLARGAVGTALEVQVAQPSIATLGQHDALAMGSQVEQQFARIFIVDLRAHRHAQQDVVAALAVLVGTTAVFAPPRLVLAGVAEVDQRVDVAVGLGKNRTAPTAITAVGAAERDELLATKRRCPVAAIAGHHFDPGFIDELHESSRLLRVSAFRIVGERSWSVPQKPHIMPTLPDGHGHRQTNPRKHQRHLEPSPQVPPDGCR